MHHGWHCLTALSCECVTENGIKATISALIKEDRGAGGSRIDQWAGVVVLCSPSLPFDYDLSNKLGTWLKITTKLSHSSRHREGYAAMLLCS